MACTRDSSSVSRDKLSGPSWQTPGKPRPGPSQPFSGKGPENGFPQESADGEFQPRQRPGSLMGGTEGTGGAKPGSGIMVRRQHDTRLPNTKWTRKLFGAAPAFNMPHKNGNLTHGTVITNKNIRSEDEHHSDGDAQHQYGTLYNNISQQEPSSGEMNINGISESSFDPDLWNQEVSNDRQDNYSMYGMRDTMDLTAQSNSIYGMRDGMGSTTDMGSMYGMRGGMESTAQANSIYGMRDGMGSTADMGSMYGMRDGMGSTAHMGSMYGMRDGMGSTAHMGSMYGMRDGMGSTAHVGSMYGMRDGMGSAAHMGSMYGMRDGMGSTAHMGSVYGMRGGMGSTADTGSMCGMSTLWGGSMYGMGELTYKNHGGISLTDLSEKVPPGTRPTTPQYNQYFLDIPLARTQAHYLDNSVAQFKCTDGNKKNPLGDASRPKEPEVGQPTEPEAKQPKEAEVGKLKEAEVVKPKEAEVVKPKEAEVVQAKEAKPKIAAPAAHNGNIHALVVVSDAAASAVTGKEAEKKVRLKDADGSTVEYEVDEVLQASSLTVEGSVLLQELRRQVEASHHCAVILANGKRQESVSLSVAQTLLKSVMATLKKNEEEKGTKYEVYMTAAAMPAVDSVKDLFASPAKEAKPLQLGSSPMYGTCIVDLQDKPVKSEGDAGELLQDALNASSDANETILVHLVVKQIKKTSGTPTDVFLSAMQFLFLRERCDRLAGLHEKDEKVLPISLFKDAVGGNSCTLVVAAVSGGDPNGEKNILKNVGILRKVKNSPPRSGNLSRFVEFTKEQEKKCTAMAEATKDAAEKARYGRLTRKMMIILDDAWKLMAKPEGTKPRVYLVPLIPTGKVRSELKI